MKPISAADAVSPAFTRMREVLTQPFRFGTMLKIALVTMMAEVGCLSVAVQLPFQGSTLLNSATNSAKLPDGAKLAMLLVPLAILLILSAIWIVLGYIFSRLRFVVFDLVVWRRTSVVEAWRRYRAASWRYFGLNLLVLIALMIILLAIASPFLIGLLRAVRTNNPAAILPHTLALVLGGIATSLIVHLIDSALRDFFLPQMALEDASIEQSTAGFVELLRDNPGEVILYLLLKFGLTLAIGMALGIGLLLCAGLIGLGLGGVGFLLFHLLWADGTGGRVVVVAYGIVAGLSLILLYVVGLILASGVSGVFRVAYAAYFFGSRYAPLGILLEPPAAVVETPPYSQTLLPLPPPVW